MMFGQPGFEHQNTPQPVVPVALPAAVFGPDSSDGRTVDPSLAHRPRRHEEITRPRPQLVAEPRTERRVEAHLRALDDLRWEHLLRNPPEHDLADTAGGLDRRGLAPRPFEETVVEEGRPNFE